MEKYKWQKQISHICWNNNDLFFKWGEILSLILSFFVNFSVYSRYSQEAHDHKQENMLWQ